MSKKVMVSVLSLGLLAGGFSATSGLASTEVLVKADKAFIESIENNEVSPQFLPAVVPAVVVGAKVVGGAAAAGFGAAAGAWAFGKVTGNLSVQEELDYQIINQAFDK